MPGRTTTSVRRLISPIDRSSGLVEWIFGRWSLEQLMKPMTSVSASSRKVASLGSLAQLIGDAAPLGSSPADGPRSRPRDAAVRALRPRRVALKVTEQPIDTSTAAGKCFLDIAWVFAEFEISAASGRWRVSRMLKRRASTRAKASTNAAEVPANARQRNHALSRGEGTLGLEQPASTAWRASGVPRRDDKSAPTAET